MSFISHLWKSKCSWFPGELLFHQGSCTTTPFSIYRKISWGLNSSCWTYLLLAKQLKELFVEPRLWYGIGIEHLTKWLNSIRVFYRVNSPIPPPALLLNLVIHVHVHHILLINNYYNWWMMIRPESINYFYSSVMFSLSPIRF